MCSLRSLVCFFLCFGSVSLAQDESFRYLEIDLKNSVTISLSPDDDNMVSISIPQSDTRVDVKEVPVRRTVSETRTRTVTINGTSQQQTYTVNVPITEMVRQTATVSVPLQPRIVSLPIDRIDVWDRKGKSLRAEQLRSRLERPVSAISLKERWNRADRIEAAQLSVLRDDVLFVFAKQLNSQNYPKQVP